MTEFSIRCACCNREYIADGDTRSEVLAQAIADGWALVCWQVRCPEHKDKRK